MHDPMTLAWEIKSPFKRKSALFKDGYRETLVAIWHVDPEKDGTDDSCDWFNSKRKRWRIHPQYHFWHFKIQIPLLQHLQRFLWGKCSDCGEGLGWKKPVVSHQWDSDGPKWFRSEKYVSCFRCTRAGYPVMASR